VSCEDSLNALSLVYTRGKNARTGAAGFFAAAKQAGGPQSTAVFVSLMIMPGLARLLVKLGLLLIVAGAIVYALDRFGIRIGHLPGDIAWRRKNVAVYFPIATSLILSILLSLLFYILSRFRR